MPLVAVRIIGRAIPEQLDAGDISDQVNDHKRRENKYQTNDGKYDHSAGVGNFLLVALGARPHDTSPCQEDHCSDDGEHEDNTYPVSDDLLSSSHTSSWNGLWRIDRLVTDSEGK